MGVIRMKLVGKCQSCPAFEEKLSAMPFRAFGAEERQLDVFAVCANQALCEHLQRYLEEHPGRQPTGLEYEIEP